MKLNKEQLRVASRQAKYIGEKLLKYENNLTKDIKELLQRIYGEMFVMQKNKSLPSQFTIKSNYLPDFIAVLRHNYTKVYEEFYDFNRKLILKGFDPNIHLKSQSPFDKEIDSKIDKEIEVYMTLFINNVSEKRANYIAETTADKVYKHISKANNSIQDLKNEKQNEIAKNNNKLSKITTLLTASLQNIIAKKNKVIQNEISEIDKEYEMYFEKFYNDITKSDAQSRGEAIGVTEMGMVAGEVLSKEKDAIEKEASNSIIKAGVYQGMILSDFIYGRAWLETFLAQQPRDKHIAISGEVKQGATYSNGLRHPRDELGPASETVNCHCIEVWAPKL